MTVDTFLAFLTASICCDVDGDPAAAAKGRPQGRGDVRQHVAVTSLSSFFKPLPPPPPGPGRPRKSGEPHHTWYLPQYPRYSPLKIPSVQVQTELEYPRYSVLS